MPYDHPQVLVHVPDFEMAEIDEDLAPLIQALWRSGVRTYMSCQDNAPEGYAWICFPDAGEAERFMAIAIPRHQPEEGSIYDRARNVWDFPGEPWLFAANVEDEAVEYEVDEDQDTMEEHHPTGVPEWRFHISVRFPRGDLAAVTAAVQQAVTSEG